MSAYVPPHLRRSTQPRDAVDPTSIARPTLYDKTDIRRLMKTETISDICTLTVSATKDEVTEKEKGELRGIVLYREEHPDWPTDRQILCKSNLDILEDIQSKLKTSDSDCKLESPVLQPVYPVFEETKGLYRGKFTFSGWFRISSIELLEAHSPRLVEIFSRKFTRNGQKIERYEEAWRNSLLRRWAIVTLEKDNTRVDQPPKLSRNVNDMLKASRDAARALPMISNVA